MLSKSLILHNSVSSCEPNQCENGGTCMTSEEAEDGFYCECISGYQGDLCETAIESESSL